MARYGTIRYNTAWYAEIFRFRRLLKHYPQIKEGDRDGEGGGHQAPLLFIIHGRRGGGEGERKGPVVAMGQNSTYAAFLLVRRNTGNGATVRVWYAGFRLKKAIETPPSREDIDHSYLGREGG